MENFMQNLLKGGGTSENPHLGSNFFAGGCNERCSRWFGCLCLVGLEFLASLHLHGAVDNPVGSQRLQSLHLHDHHLRGRDISVS